MKVFLDENNSGGSWWLTRPQFDALFAGGWNKPDPKPKGLFSPDTEDVPYAWRHGVWGEFESLRAAVESFERLTGEDFFAQGCNCCGVPFSMHTEDYKEHISGADGEIHVVRPW